MFECGNSGAKDKKGCKYSGGTYLETDVFTQRRKACQAKTPHHTALLLMSDYLQTWLKATVAGW